jgi:hypothetical protein
MKHTSLPYCRVHYQNKKDLKLRPCFSQTNTVGKFQTAPTVDIGWRKTGHTPLGQKPFGRKIFGQEFLA